MLAHINQADIAAKVHNAWLKTMEDGMHTYDIFKPDTSKQKLGTKEFAKAVIERLGQKPSKLKEVIYNNFEVKVQPSYDYRNIKKAKKELKGVDVFLHWTDGRPIDLGNKVKDLDVEGMKLVLISNRGVDVWPGGMEQTFCVDHWRCRYESTEPGKTITHDMITAQLDKLYNAGFDFIKIENLYNFDGVPGYSAAKR